jgi:hypothetical protein
LRRLLAYFAFLAAIAAAYWTVPIAGVVLVCIASAGFVVISELLRRNASERAVSRSVLAAYVLTGVIVIGTVMAVLPPPAFWVVSAVLPAWQAHRLIDRNSPQQALRLLHVSIAVYAWVLAVALWLPALLLYR